jgi:hypothetical protein
MLEVLEELGTHPTVEQIRERVAVSDPGGL